MTADSTESRKALLSSQAWDELRHWYQANGRHHFPWRAHRNPWAILVAETLLHRTRAEIVARLFPPLLDRFACPEAVIADPDAWLRMTRSAGLGWRATSFVQACNVLVERFESQVPVNRDALLLLPGVGNYIAAAVRCFGHGIHDVLVDTNTIRLASRISGTPIDPTRHRRKDVGQAVAQLGESGNAPSQADNYALLDLAALVCLPGEPICSQCPVRDECVTGTERCDGSHPVTSDE